MVVQRAFRKKIKLERHNLVLSPVTISKWVKTFRETNAVTSIGAVGRKRSIQHWRIVKNCE